MPPTLLEEAVEYAWYAERFGWPPSVVDDQPAWVMDRLPILMQAFDEAKAAVTERARQEAQREAGG